MNRLYALCITLGCVLVCTTATAEVHKCTDAQGNVTYRDTPCGGTANTIKRKSAATLVPDADARMKKTQRLLRAYEEERREEKQQQADARAEKEKHVRNCALAKDRLRRFERAGRLYGLNEEGERVYLSDAARDQSTERARADVAKWCK